MIDDHEVTIQGYKSILDEFSNNNYAFETETSNSFSDALDKIKYSIAGENSFDIIFLDISMEPDEKLDIYSGEDLGIKIREISPQSSIVVLTMHNENYRLYNILKSLNPEGFLIKSEVQPSELNQALEEIINDRFYFSYSIKNLLRKQIISEVTLDNIDRSILYRLSTGMKTKNLTKVIPLSLPAIEKRKRNMKEAFGVDTGGDLILLEKAKKLGFL